jgi:hypothetical protein
MTDQSIEDERKEAFFEWAERYGLDFEPLDNASRRYDCFQAYLAGMQAARQSSQSEPVAGYVSKLPITNPQSIRADANDVFNIPVYAAPQQAIPSGWKLVPIDPTEAMVDAGWKANINSTKPAPYNMLKEAIKAAISASPTAPIESDK